MTWIVLVLILAVLFRRGSGPMLGVFLWGLPLLSEDFHVHPMGARNNSRSSVSIGRAGSDQCSYLRGRGNGSIWGFLTRFLSSLQGIDELAPPPHQAHHRSIVLLPFGMFTQVVVTRCGMAVRRNPCRSVHRVLQALVAGPGRLPARIDVPGRLVIGTIPA